MESFFEAIGLIGLGFLLLVGLLAGLGASAMQGGRHRGRNVAIGVAGALLLPVLLALAGAGVLAAGGLVLALAVGAIGAVIVLIVARLLFD